MIVCMFETYSNHSGFTNTVWTQNTNTRLQINTEVHITEENTIRRVTK